MPTARVRNGEIYYEECGSGELIVLMAGLGHGAAYFEKTLPLLSGLGRAVAIDPRGVGRSTSSTEHYSVEAWAAVERLFAAVRRNSPERYLAFIRAILAFGRFEPGQQGQPKLTERLGEIRVPTCVIVGGQDILTPLSLSEQIASRIKGAELHVVPGCGHITFTERPAETAAIIKGFLGRVLQSQASA